MAFNYFINKYDIFFCNSYNRIFLSVRMELTTNMKICFSIFRKLSVMYHYTLKRLLGFTKYFSNNLTGNYLGTLMFGPFQNYRPAKFYHRMSKSTSSCIIRHRVNLITFLSYSRYVKKSF